MSLENSINRLAQVIKAVKSPKTSQNFGPITIDDKNCICTEVAGPSEACASADCGDTFCRRIPEGWLCKDKFKLPKRPESNIM